jgi:hypothetical protein
VVETWQDEHGTLWELVGLDLGDLEGPCLVRQGFSRADWMDGDVREGVEVIARFEDPEDARRFLAEEGFTLR